MKINWRRILFGVGADRLSRADQELIDWAHSLVLPWSPFNEDGYLRDDLLAVDADGNPNPRPNDGFYLMGAMHD